MKDWIKDYNSNDRLELCKKIAMFNYYLKNLEVAIQYNLINECNDKRLIRFKEVVEEYDFLLDEVYDEGEEK